MVPPNSSWRKLWPALLFAGALVALGASFTVSVSSHPWAVALLWVIGAVCLIQVAGVVIKDGDIFAPPMPFIVFTALFYIIRPLGILSGAPTVVQNFSSRDMCLALGLVIVSTLTFYAGYWMPGSRKLARQLPVGAEHWPKTRLYVIVAVTFVIACGAWGLFMARVGGLPYWLLNLHYGVHHLRRGIGYLYALASFSGLAFILLYGYAVKWRVNRIFLYSFGFMCLALIMTLGERGLFVVWVLMAFTIYHYLGRRLDWRRATLYVLPLIILFVGIGMWREYTTNRKIPSLKYQTRALQMNLTSFDMLLYLSHSTPDPIDYQWGRFLPAFLTIPIPRAIFPDKQETVTIFVNDQALQTGYAGNIAISLPGEGYINAGLAGVVLWSLLLGFISRAAYEYLKNNRTNISAVLLYSLWLALLIGFFRGGLTDFPAAMALLRIGFMIILIGLLSLGQSHHAAPARTATDVV